MKIINIFKKKWKNKVQKEKSSIYSPSTQCHFRLLESQTLIPVVEFKKKRKILNGWYFIFTHMGHYAIPLNSVTISNQKPFNVVNSSAMSKEIDKNLHI
jgi:archaellum component FlaF (FlaF/FlaG flagellin family)